MKKVFSTRELVHIWANQQQTEGRNSNGSVFFDETSIYSYGRHFKMAELFPELRVVLFNSDSYSVTTSKHQSYTQRAVDRNQYNRQFSIPDCNVSGAGQYYVNQIKANLKLALNARKNKVAYLSNARWYVTQAKQLSEIFPYDSDGHGMYIPTELFHYFNNPIELTETEIAEYKAIQKQNKEAEKRRQAEIELMTQNDVQNWIDGNSSYFPSSVSRVYLRILYEDTVQTSKGARVPLTEAKQLFTKLREALGSSTSFTVDGSIGGYSCRSFRNNVLTIGCHEITLEEINRFAISQGWVNSKHNLLQTA